jgi:methylamine---corrinoid protein Co-methyltransferase
MLTLLDIAERTQKGPKMEDKAWNLGLFHKMNELAARYDIQVPAETGFFNYDDALPDRVFAAAIDFLAQAGVYCLSTGRVVQFSMQEVLQAAREAPAQVIVGEGRDQRTIKRHHPGNIEAVNRHYGGHAPYSEKMLPLVVKNFAQIPSNDYIEGFNFTNVDGREIHGMPIEAYAGRRAVSWMREGVRKAGRPGMAIAFYPISTRSSVLIAPLNPDYGLRRTDGVLLSILPDVKMEQDLLTAAIVYEDYGAFRLNGGGGGFVGSFAGSVPGAMIEGVVKHLAGWLCYHDLFCYSTGLEMMGQRMHSPKDSAAGGGRLLHWGSHVVAQALQRNTNLILWGIAGAGWGRTMRAYLLRSAMSAIRGQVTGVNGAGGGRHTQRGIVYMDCSQTPQEAELGDEVGTAVLRGGVDLTRAEIMLGKIVAEMDIEVQKEDWLPKHVSEFYDFIYHRPMPEYAQAHLSVKETLAGMGLAL